MNQGAWPFLIKLSQMGLVTKMKKEKEIRRFRSFFREVLIFQSSYLNPHMLSFLQPSVGEIDLMAIEFDQIRLDSVEKCAVPTMNRPHIHAIRKIPPEMEVAPRYILLKLSKLFTLLSLLHCLHYSNCFTLPLETVACMPFRVK